jgi:uncharacterized protein YdhG (YjbR/CyaY superfamily)
MKSKAATVTEYLAQLPPDRRAALSKLRDLVRKTVPEAVEGMQYGMAAYTLGDLLCALASQKHYMALYVCDVEGVDRYRDQLGAIDCGKGCLRFRCLEDLPLDVVEKILTDTVKKRRSPQMKSK